MTIIRHSPFKLKKKVLAAMFSSAAEILNFNVLKLKIMFNHDIAKAFDKV